jgi:MoxR-like ATPase
MDFNFDFSNVGTAVKKVEEKPQEPVVIPATPTPTPKPKAVVPKAPIKEVIDVAKSTPKPVVKEATVSAIEKAKVDAKDKIVNLYNVDMPKEAQRLAKGMFDIKKSLNEVFVERENEIDMLAVTFVSGTNAFFHGAPGTGKSDLVEKFSRRFTGSEYFRMLMSKTTEPSEVFGPVSINALKNDVYKVVTKGKLPSANIAFLDEVGKANSAVLNGLLTIMNERLFFNDVVEEVPIVSIVGASNEFFEEESLAALYDRFLLRCNVEKIKDANNRVKLFKSFLASRDKNSTVNVDKTVAVTTSEATMSFEDLKLMMELSKKVKLTVALIGEYNKLFAKLEKEGVTVSDRRKNEALKVVQANAIIEGRLTASTADFAPLVYCFWEELTDIPKIQGIINKLANPHQEFIKEYKDSLTTMKKEMNDFIEKNKNNADYDITKAVKITEARAAVNFALDKIDEKIDSVKEPKVKNDIQTMRKGFDEFLAEITDLLIK